MSFSIFKMKKGQMIEGPLSIALGVLFTIIFIMGVAYPYVKNNASVTALNVSATAPEYGLIQQFPLFVAIIALVGLAGLLYLRFKR